MFSSLPWNNRTHFLPIACLLTFLCLGSVGADEALWTPDSVILWVGGRGHPELTAAEFRKEGAKSYLNGAGKQPNPQIKLSLSRGDVQEDANALTQRLEIAGQPALRKQIASSIYQQADQQTVLISRKVVLEALTAYYHTWMARRELEISAVNHHLALQLEEIARRRFFTGQISQDEWRQARLLSQSALATLQRNGVAGLAAEENFRILVGYPDQSSLYLPGGNTPPRLERATLPLKQEIMARVEQLPEIEIAEARARQAKLEAELAGKARAPDLYVYAYRANSHRVAQQGIQFGVSFPLFDWGEIGAEHKRKKLLAKSLQADAEASRRTIKAELLKARQLCRGQMSYVERLEEQFQDREVLAHHSLMAYNLGLVTLLEAINTQRNYQDSLLELAQEAVALETQRVNLHLTIKETL